MTATSDMDFAAQAATWQFLSTRSGPFDVLPDDMYSFVMQDRSRLLCVTAAVTIAAADASRTENVALLLLRVLECVGAVDAACLREIRAFIRRQPPGANEIFRQLAALAEMHAAAADANAHVPVISAEMEGGARTASAEGMTMADVPSYYSIPPFAPVASAAAAAALAQFESHRRYVQTTEPSGTAKGTFADECAAVAIHRNKELAGAWRYAYRARALRDYTEQPRLALSAGDVMEQTRLLFAPITRQNATTASGAAAVFVKLICDAFTSRLAVASHGFLVLREVSEGFLHLLTNLLLLGEDPSVKIRAFDILANVALHVQCVDAAATFPGSTRAVLNEVEWMLSELLVDLAPLTATHTGNFADVKANRVAAAALKCALLVVPSERMCLLPAAALRVFLRIPTVVSCQADLYDVLTSALAVRVVGASWTAVSTADSTRPIRLNPVAFNDCGGTGGVLELLAAAPTAASANTLFFVLYVHYCRRVAELQHGGTGGDVDAGAVTDLRPLRTACRLGLPFTLRWALVGTAADSQRVLVPLRKALHQDAEPDVRAVLSSFVCDLVGIAPLAGPSGIAALEPPLAAMAPAAVAAEATARMNQLLDERDAVVIDVAVRATAHAILREGLTDAEAGPAPATAAFCAMIAQTQSPRARAACMVVMRRVAAAARAHRSVSLSERFGELVRAAAGSCVARPTAAALPFACQLARTALEVCAQPLGPAPSAMAGDIVRQLEGGAVGITVGAIEAIGGTQTLWRLYRSLRAADVSPFVLGASACQLRLLLVRALASMLEGLPFDATSAEQWRQVLQDPYVPCSVEGARQIVRTMTDPSALLQSQGADGAAGVAARNPYLTAMQLFER